MALNRQGIETAQENARVVKNLTERLVAVSSEMISRLNSDVNFQIFREGTARGESIYDNIKNCCDVITTKLSPSIDSMVQVTQTLLDGQSELNRPVSQVEPRRDM